MWKIVPSAEGQALIKDITDNKNGRFANSNLVNLLYTYFETKEVLEYILRLFFSKSYVNLNDFTTYFRISLKRIGFDTIKDFEDYVITEDDMVRIDKAGHLITLGFSSLSEPLSTELAVKVQPVATQSVATPDYAVPIASSPSSFISPPALPAVNGLEYDEEDYYRELF